VERWDRWCCLELLTSSSVVRVLLDGAVHIISVIYLSVMALISYLLLHSRKGFSTLVQGIFGKYPCIFTLIFSVSADITNVVFLNIDFMLLSTLCPFVYKVFRIKGFGCMQSKLCTAAISSSGLCETLIASWKGPKQVVIGRSRDWNTGWVVKKCRVPYLKDGCCMGGSFKACIVM